jgi:hypothetical protein
MTAHDSIPIKLYLKTGSELEEVKPQESIELVNFTIE